MAQLWILNLVLWTSYTAFANPLTMQVIDMTYTFDESTLHWPTHKKFEMILKMNETTAGGFWLQAEEYRSATHVGTHMDAPCHFAKGAWTIEEIPLKRLIAPAAVVDITEKAEVNADVDVEVEDLQKWENETGQMLNDVILLIRTGWGNRWPDREAFSGTAGNDTTQLHFPGLAPEAAQWLVDHRHIYGLGTEALSLDRGTSTDFMTHRILLAENIFGLENVANMEELPIYGAMLHAMPMKMGSASGAPVRLIATFPKLIYFQRDRRSVTERSLREVIVFN